jgi:predicted transcriptional regulator YdeE
VVEMELTFVAKDPIRIVGMLVSTLLKDAREKNTISILHDNFSKRTSEITNRINPSISYGVSIDPPNYRPKFDEFKWVAGVEVGNFDHIPDGMESLELPSNTYVCVRKTNGVYDFIYKWFRESEEYTFADTYSIELYDTNQEYVLLMFPIKKLQGEG